MGFSTTVKVVTVNIYSGVVSFSLFSFFPCYNCTFLLDRTRARFFNERQCKRENKRGEDIHSGNGFNEATPTYTRPYKPELTQSLLLTYYGPSLNPPPILRSSQLRHSSCCSWPQCPGLHCACVLYLIFFFNRRRRRKKNRVVLPDKLEPG